MKEGVEQSADEVDGIPPGGEGLPVLTAGRVNLAAWLALRC